MEENRFDRLPGGLFTRSFLRQYTRALELNENEILALLKQQFEPQSVALPEPPRQIWTSHLPHVPYLGWLALVMIGCAGLFNLWENGRKSLPHANAASHVPKHEGGDISNAGTSRVTPAATLEPERRPIEDPLPARSAVTQLGLGPANASMRVVFAASEPVWLSIESDGIGAYTGTLESLQTKEFDAHGKMTVLVGNAGGLTISLNGAPVALTGAHGEVRSLVLTPEGAHVVPRKSQAPLITPAEQTTPQKQ
jgi:cytoskeletal protein RodZ